eukprot:980399-Pelagomonas_calceolata.AAC.1
MTKKAFRMNKGATGPAVGEGNEERRLGLVTIFWLSCWPYTAPLNLSGTYLKFGSARCTPRVPSSCTKGYRLVGFSSSSAQGT